MEKYIGLIAASLPIYGMIISGWFVRKIGWMKPESDSSIMRIAIDFTLPCFIIYNMLGNPKLRNIEFSLGAISIGAIGMAVGLLVSWAAARIIKLKVGDGLRTFTVSTASHNYGFFMIALVAIVFAQNSEALIGLIITHNIGCDIVYWSIGFLIISNSGKLSIKNFLRGPFIAVFVALGIVWTGADKYVPEFAISYMKIIGQCAIPLNLMLFGALIYDWLGREKFSLKIVGTACLVRMLILPTMYVAAAAFLPIGYYFKWLLAIQAIAPCGVTSTILARYFGGHPRIAVQITVLTTVIAVFTVPIWLEIGMAVIGEAPAVQVP